MSQLKAIDELLDEDEKPEWLIPTFFDSIVEREFGLETGKYQSSIVSITPVVGNSENHRTITCRVLLEICKGHDCDELIQFSVIVKALLHIMPEYEEIGIFPREMNMYDVILPKLEAEWKLHGDKDVKFAPKCYEMTTTPTRVIVLEDLMSTKPQYQLKSHMAGLDWEHSQLVLDKLAKFHASSAVCYDDDKGVEYNKMLYNGVLHDDMRPVIELGRYTYIASFMQIFDQYEFLRPYVDKIRSWFDTPFEQLAHTLNPNPNEFNVINHCDCWVNNLLFACDESQKPKDVILIDYQACAFGSPVLDLYTFIITSVTDDIKENRLDELIEYYYTKLADNLKRLDYSTRSAFPTWQEFRRTMQQKSIWAASSLTTILPLTMLESDEKVSIEIFFRNDEDALNFRYRAYNNPKYLKSLEILLRFLAKQDTMLGI